MQWIKEVELVDSVDKLRFSSSIRGISMPDFEVLDARIASALNKIIQSSHFKRRISLEKQKAPEAGPFPSRKADCLLNLRIIPVHWSQMILSRTMPTYSLLVFEMTIFRNSIQSETDFFHNDKNSIWWHLGRIAQIKNTRVWKTQDRIGLVRPGDSSEENKTWLSQTENDGEMKYRARHTK